MGKETQDVFFDIGRGLPGSERASEPTMLDDDEEFLKKLPFAEPAALIDSNSASRGVFSSGPKLRLLL